MIVRRTASILMHRPQYSFGLAKILKNQIQNGSIYRAISIVAALQIGATAISSYFVDKGIIMPIEDYLANDTIKEHEQFQIAGIVKPGSISVKRGELGCRFILTNFEDEITVLYGGETKYEFKEGETLVIQAYCPDMKNRTKLIGVSYLTKHSMDGTSWSERVGVDRQNYGLNTRVQAQL